MAQEFDVSLEEVLDRLRSRQNGFHEPYLSEMGHGRIALVSLSGAGKKALYNSLWGWEVLPSSISHLAIRQLGSFSLFELPDNSQEADDLLIQIEGHDVVVYLLDATKGLRSEDFQWIARLRMGNASLMVILNKANLLLPNDLAKLVGDLKKKLSAPVLALNAANQEAVHEIFLPALLKVCPSLGATLAAEMGTLRQRVVNHYIQQAVMASSTLNAGNPETEGLVPLIDIQMKLVKQIAEIYGYKSHNPNELSLISLSSTFVQEFTQDIQQAVSGLGWMTGNFINAFSTWLVGQIAALYYDPDSFIWKRFGKEDV